MAKRSGFQTSAQLEAERAAARIANMAHLTDAELTIRALRWDADQPLGGHQWGSVGANHYRDELRRRQASAQVAVAA